jgi:hypothetical protein
MLLSNGIIITLEKLTSNGFDLYLSIEKKKNDRVETSALDLIKMGLFKPHQSLKLFKQNRRSPSL